MFKKLPILLAFIFCNLQLQAQELLFDNGGLITQTGNPNLSVVQTSTLGLTSTGYGVSDNLGSGLFTLADDVTITGEEWTIESVTTFAYVLGELNTATPMDDYSLQIWDGDPRDAESSIIWGDHTTNLLVGQVWSGVNRVEEDDLSDPFRPIMTLELETPDLVLQPGTYWFHFFNEDVSLETATIVLGPLVPPVTISGQAETGNALIFRGNNNTWNILDDAGTDDPQGIPFQIRGSSTLSIDDNNLTASRFNIVPNPASDVISINKSADLEIDNITIYNLVGQKVIERNKDDSKSLEVIDISEITAGIYLLNITSQGQTLTKKLIKR